MLYNIVLEHKKSLEKNQGIVGKPVFVFKFSPRKKNGNPFGLPSVKGR